MNWFLEFFFGCSHRRTTFPMNVKRRGAYIVCLNCGKEFAYSWNEMRIQERSSKVGHMAAPVELTESESAEGSDVG